MDQAAKACVEAYEDRIVIRPRNFAKHTMNRKVMIRDGKPYWEQPVGD